MNQEVLNEDKDGGKVNVRSRGGGTSKRTIKVNAISELPCPPDRFTFSISVRSTKADVEAAQTSVQRRSDYIQQVLRNSDVKEQQVKIATEVSRFDEEKIFVQTNFLVQSTTFSTCQVARNMIIGKLDSAVQCSAIGLHHSAECKAEGRQQAFKLAVGNARKKALTVSQALGVRLGPALEVIEREQKETATCIPGLGECVNSPPLLGSSACSMHQKINSATLTYVSVVEVVFETVPLRTCHHKKCPKHCQ